MKIEVLAFGPDEIVSQKAARPTIVQAERIVSENQAWLSGSQAFVCQATGLEEVHRCFVLLVNAGSSKVISLHDLRTLSTHSTPCMKE